MGKFLASYSAVMTFISSRCSGWFYYLVETCQGKSIAKAVSLHYLFMFLESTGNTRLYSINAKILPLPHFPVSFISLTGFYNLSEKTSLHSYHTVHFGFILNFAYVNTLQRAESYLDVLYSAAQDNQPHSLMNLNAWPTSPSELRVTQT